MNQYLEILYDMQQEITAALIKNGVADNTAQYAAHTTIEQIRKNWGGIQIYIPKGLKLNNKERNKQIANNFTGKNYNKLARQYGLSIQRIYKILEKQNRLDND